MITRPRRTPDGIYRIFYYENSNNKYGDGEGTIYLKRDWTANNTDLSSIVITGGYTPTEKAKTKMHAMNSSYKNKRGGTATTSLNDNEKEAIWLCDESKFTTYKDTKGKYADYVNYVIGAPSIEMYVDSYNSVVHTTNNYTLGTSYSSTKYPGYIYTLNGKQSEMSKSDYSTGTDSIDYIGYNNMYCGKSGMKGSYYWWLASPSSYGSNYVCDVLGNRALLGASRSGCGICPIVSLRQGAYLNIMAEDE